MLELLVAMFIAAIIFAMGYGAINQTVKNRASLQDAQHRLLEVQTAMRVIEQDFVQLAPRPIRQPVGSTHTAALLADPKTQPVVALTRAGWANPTGLQRPALQRVAYYFDNGTLRREYWNVLDPTQTSTTAKRDLLTHLKSVSFRYMDQTHTWLDHWPSVVTDLRSRPIAVEITLETDDWGKLVRIVEIAA